MEEDGGRVWKRTVWKRTVEGWRGWLEGRHSVAGTWAGRGRWPCLEEDGGRVWKKMVWKGTVAVSYQVFPSLAGFEVCQIVRQGVGQEVRQGL